MSNSTTKTLEVTSTVGCPLKCGFCPQQALVSNYVGERHMTFSALKHFLRTVPKDVVIDWAGFSEPLLAKEFAQMVAWLTASGYKQSLYTTLVGLDDDKAAMISCHPFETIRVHVPDTEAMVIRDGVWIPLHEKFRSFGISASYMTMGDLTPGVRDHMAELNLRVENPRMLSRGGNLGWVAPSYPLKGKIRCAANRWYNNVLLPSGQVVACCMDYGLTMTVGDLSTQHHNDIVAKAAEFERNDNPPDDSICRSCDWCAPT